MCSSQDIIIYFINQNKKCIFAGIFALDKGKRKHEKGRKKNVSFELTLFDIDGEWLMISHYTVLFKNRTYIHNKIMYKKKPQRIISNHTNEKSFSVFFFFHSLLGWFWDVHLAFLLFFYVIRTERKWIILFYISSALVRE